MYFRAGCNQNDAVLFNLKGSMSSLNTYLERGTGPARYDFRFQNIAPAEITEMGLPLSVIICSWQR
jgi:hypothetical protein